MDEILRYFPDLTAEQQRHFAMLDSLYHEWNAKINVISRKDIDNLYVHHVLHSLAIAKFISFVPGTQVMDVGCGGGFPGIPLAIMFPECRFLLVDSIGKKIRVCNEIIKATGLTNVEAVQERVEQEKRMFDFVVSRATMPLTDLVRYARKNIEKKQKNALPNGFISLKGGDLQAETQPFRKTVELYNLSDWLHNEFFFTKRLVYLPIG